MPNDRNVEDMEKFMSVLMDVKVSLAEQSAKLDNLLDMKDIINETNDIAKGARSLSKINAGDIRTIEERLENKANREDIEKIVRERENIFKNLPSWVALAISFGAFLLTYLGGM